MKLINIIIFFIYFIFIPQQIEANTFVIIRGTANCGKSTLCKILKALNNSYIMHLHY